MDIDIRRRMIIYLKAQKHILTRKIHDNHAHRVDRLLELGDENAVRSKVREILIKEALRLSDRRKQIEKILMRIAR